jgi:hypothetical protein
VLQSFRLATFNCLVSAASRPSATFSCRACELLGIFADWERIWISRNGGAGRYGIIRFPQASHAWVRMPWISLGVGSGALSAMKAAKRKAGSQRYLTAA